MATEKMLDVTSKPRIVHRTPGDAWELARAELEDARDERNRALGAIALRIQSGNISRIDPEDLERAARLVRTVRLLAPILEEGNTGA